MNMATDIDLDNVLTLSTSQVFHFKSHSDNFRRNENEPACGLTNVKSAEADFSEMPVEEAINEDKTHCSKCRRWLKRTTDIDLHDCKVCGDLNVLSPYPFTMIDVEGKPASHDEAWVCSECITKLWNGLQKVDK